MPAYMVFTRESTENAEALRTYSALAVPSLKGHPATPRAFYGALEVLEGPDFEGAVIVEFPSAAEAKAWYNSPDYQAALPHRKAGATYRVFIVDGIPAA